MREQQVQRHDYGSVGSKEQFIVPLLRRHIEQVLSTYGKPASLNSRALDVGCGLQPFRKNLEDLGYFYSSIDAQQNSKGSVDVVCEIDRPLPSEIFNYGSFDFILCTEVMEHVAEWDMAFHNFAQLLAPGGRLFITCPHFYQLHEEPYDFWRATPYAFHYFGKKFGLKILHQVQAGDAWDVLGTLLANSYSLPSGTNLSDRILNKIVSYCRSYLFQLLVSRRLQSSVQLNGSLYLANIVVLEK